MLESEGVASTLRVLDLIPGFETRPDLVNLPERLREGRSSVALIGQVKRGKSRLFNDLVGAKISPEAAVPETAAIIHAWSGSPEARGWKRDGTELPLATEPEAFSRAVARGSTTDVIEAWIARPFRLPAELALIDTPGVNEADWKVDNVVDKLVDQWRHSSAGAVIVVLAYPTGIDDKDFELIDHAEKAFPGRTLCVLKATDSETTESDLDEWAEYSANQGRSVMVLPQERPTERWGASQSWRSLENQISALAGAATADLASASRRFDAAVLDACAYIDHGFTAATWLALERLRETVDSQTDARLVAAIDAERERVLAVSRVAKQKRRAAEETRRNEEIHQRELQAEARRQQNLESAARSAVQIASASSAAISSQAPAGFIARQVETINHRRELEAVSAARIAYDEVLRLGRDGAVAAITEVIRVLRSQPEREQLGFNKDQLILAIGEPQRQLSLLHESHLSVDELKVVATQSAYPDVQQASLGGLVRALRHGADDDVGRFVIGRQTEPHTSEAIYILGERCVGRLAAMVADNQTEPFAYLDTAVSIDSDLDELTALLDASGSPQAVEKGRQLRADRRALESAVTSSRVSRIDLGLRQIYTNPVLDERSWREAEQYLMGEIQRVEDSPSTSASEHDNLAIWAAASTTQADSYVKRSASAIKRAKRLGKREDALWMISYIGSYLLWVVSIYVAFNDFVLGAFLWVLSIGFLLVAKNQTDSDIAWQEYYASPRLAEKIPRPDGSAAPSDRHASARSGALVAFVSVALAGFVVLGPAVVLIRSAQQSANQTLTNTPSSVAGDDALSKLNAMTPEEKAAFDRFVNPPPSTIEPSTSTSTVLSALVTGSVRNRCGQPPCKVYLRSSPTPDLKQPSDAYYLDGDAVPLRCETNGSEVRDGDTGSASTRWYRTDKAQYLSALYVRVDAPIPKC